jgi:hypothetical protein
MKKFVGVLIVALLFLSACSNNRYTYRPSPRPAYKTSEGKKKTKHYNSLQYGGRSAKTTRTYYQ